MQLVERKINYIEGHKIEIIWNDEKLQFFMQVNAKKSEKKNYKDQSYSSM